MAPTVHTEIEITASPETVRSVFLDFERYKDWHPNWTITTYKTGKQPIDLKPGDQIKVNLKGMVLHPTVAENSANSFQWTGGITGLVSGTHQFFFFPSQTCPGGTTFVHAEYFGGPVATVYGWFSGKEPQTSAPFEEFNKNLKAAAEKVGF